MGWDGPMTDRQYWTWQEWLNEEEDRPSRIEQILTLTIKNQFGLEFSWRKVNTSESERVIDPNKSDVGVVMAGLGGLMDFSEVKGGDILMRRMQELKDRGEI